MLQSFKLALKSIWGNKMRSFLTMLGIIIGVAAVIILVSLVNGYMGSVVESFASMGVNQINVSVTNLTSRSLDVDEMYAFYEDNTDLFAQLSPNVSLSTTVKHGTDEMDSTSVGGYSEQYLDLKEYTMEARISEVHNLPLFHSNSTHRASTPFLVCFVHLWSLQRLPQTFLFPLGASLTQNPCHISNSSLYQLLAHAL